MTLVFSLVATASVAFVAWRLAALPAAFAWHERLLLFGGLAWTQITLTQLIAGTVLTLTPVWVALLNLGLALILALFLRPTVSLAVRPSPPSARPAPPPVWHAPRSAWHPLRSVWHAPRRLWQALQAAAAGRILPWLLLGLLMLQSALVLWAVAVLPPQGWDEWWYHLPPIARWVETGRVDLMPVAEEWQDPAQIQALDEYQRRYRLSVTGFWSNVYPLHVETAAMWSLLFLSHDRWVDGVQWPLVLLGALAVYGLTRWARVRAPGPLLAALLWALLPINQMQARTAYTDTAVAATALAAVLFFLRWAETDRKAHFLAFGLFLGLALGSKPSALGYAAVLGGLTLLAALRRAAGQPVWARIKTATAQGLALGAVAAATGGFWYLRTWLAYGNPVYPFRLSLLGIPLFKGLGSVHSLIWVANTPEEYLHAGFLANLARSWFEAGREPYSFYTRTGGFGAIWAAIGLPAVAVYAARSAWRRDWRGLFLLGLGALMLAVHPGSWWPRYAILVPGLGLVAAGWVLGEGLERRSLRPQLSALVLAAVLWSLLRADLSLAHDLPLALALPPEQRTIGRLYLGDYAPVEQMVPARASIGYAPMTFIYPLFGPGLERRVEQVDGATPKAWLDSIRRTGVGYVSVLKSYGPHYAWAKAAPEWLEEIATPGEVALFAVRDRTPETAGTGERGSGAGQGTAAGAAPSR